jgi:xylose isomerase
VPRWRTATRKLTWWLRWHYHFEINMCAHNIQTFCSNIACRDIAPEGATLAETNKNLDLVAEVLMMLSNSFCMPVYAVIFFAFSRVQGHCP